MTLEEPKIGERAWIEPANGLDVPVPVALRKNVTPADNKVRKGPLPMVKKGVPKEVEWSSYWRRRLVRGEVKYADKGKIAAILKERKAVEAKAKADAEKAAKASEGGSR